MNEDESTTLEEPRAEYDFEGGVRGKYVEQYRRGARSVMLEPDVASAFRDSESVNRALRVLLESARSAVPDKDQS